MTTYDTEKDMTLYGVSLCDILVGLVVDKTFRTINGHENTINIVINEFGFDNINDYVNTYPGNTSKGSMTMNQLDEYWGEERGMKKFYNSQTIYEPMNLFIPGDDDVPSEFELRSCMVYPTVSDVSTTREYKRLGRNVYMLYISKDWSENIDETE